MMMRLDGLFRARSVWNPLSLSVSVPGSEESAKTQNNRIKESGREMSSFDRDWFHALLAVLFAGVAVGFLAANLIFAVAIACRWII